METLKKFRKVLTQNPVALILLGLLMLSLYSRYKAVEEFEQVYYLISEFTDDFTDIKSLILKAKREPIEFPSKDFRVINLKQKSVADT